MQCSRSLYEYFENVVFWFDFFLQIFVFIYSSAGWIIPVGSRVFWVPASNSWEFSARFY